MSAELEKELAELKTLVIAQRSTTLEASGKWIRWVQSLIALVVVVVGLGVNWGMTKAELTSVQTQLVEIKTEDEKSEKIWREEVDKLRTEVIEMRMHNAAVDQVMQEIKSDVIEIKDDVKTMMRSRRPR